MTNQISVIEQELEKGGAGELVSRHEHWCIVFSTGEVAQLHYVWPPGSLVALLDNIEIFTRAEDGVGVSGEEWGDPVNSETISLLPIIIIVLNWKTTLLYNLNHVIIKDNQTHIH